MSHRVPLFDKILLQTEILQQQTECIAWTKKRVVRNVFLAILNAKITIVNEIGVLVCRQK